MQGRTQSIGLGLAVSRKLAQLMGGNLTYRRVNGWSEFPLELPLAPNDRIPALTSSSGDESKPVASICRIGGSWAGTEQVRRPPANPSRPPETWGA